ncbi:MAG: DUF2934 domain-containing protein [Pirellulales bacterium]|nr:DUF2934 domain-containing protein [Pirellulales bacterium]
MDQATSSTTGLVDFYERRVLPNLFERLDQAFPEIRWTRTANGWLGVENSAEAKGRRLVCNQPWGFTVQDGTPASWLAYANGGTNPSGSELLKAVRKLAKLAGVRDEAIDQPLSRREQNEAQRATRYRELLEAFSAYATACLFGPAGKPVLDQLREEYGLRPDQLGTIALGVYTTADDVREYLLGVGFSDEEIDASYVTRDSRLAGRVTIPWRDPWGNLRTVVACDLTGKSTARSDQLFLKGSSRPEFFGLDVALRPTAGGVENLVLVGGLIEAALCHARGLRNVAASGNRSSTISSRQWQTLQSLGVARVTIAGGDDPSSWHTTKESIKHWLECESKVQPFAVAQGSFGTTPKPTGYARSNGNDAFATLMKAAPHGCRYLANDLIAECRSGANWSDNQIVELLGKAVELDSQVTEPERAWTMERFFWPPILETIELDWQDVRGLLARKLPEALKKREETEKSRKYKLLAADLTASASVGDIKRFEKMILATADEIRDGRQEWSAKPPKPQPMPVLPPMPAPVAEDHWQETVLETPPTPPKTRATNRIATPPPVAPPVGDTNGTTKCIRLTDESIRRRAYRLWENAGHPAGQHLFFWQEAERQLLDEAAAIA